MKKRSNNFSFFVWQPLATRVILGTLFLVLQFQDLYPTFKQEKHAQYFWLSSLSHLEVDLDTLGSP